MRALDGLFVIAIEQAVAAPACTMCLADAGARVIKIERHGGETARHYDRSVHGTSAYFAWLNRGKESAELDLKDGHDLQLVHSMIARADVVVQNLAPGAAARLGLAASQLTEKYSRLIAVDIVGYGQDTAYRSNRAYDMLVQAEAGICSVTGTADAPAKVGVSVADLAAGMNAYARVLEALIERQRTGRGQAIEIAMFDGMAEWMAVPLLHLAHAGRDTRRCGLSHASIRPYGRYWCRDEEGIVVAVQNPDEWRRFCGGVLRRPELEMDVRFASNEARVAQADALDECIAGVFESLTFDEVSRRLNDNQIAWSRESDVRTLAGHPALRCIDVALPDGESCRVPRPAGRKYWAVGAVPVLGEHTVRIRAEFGTLGPKA